MSIQREALVTTTYGKLEGLFENDLYIFRGIPFATPPVGELRWLPPRPCRPWNGIRKAKSFGAAAPQNQLEGGPPDMPVLNEVEPQSEDCLFLNVYTPGLDDKKRPVMVWIHGGAFSMGSGSQSMYNGTALAKHGDMVLVTLNYRLGVLGFLNLRETTGGKIPSTGIEGMLDQIAGLEWVRDNIAAFGGDPANVTIFGESAGGMSVGCLMSMPRARGLFHKAISESAVGGMARPLKESLEGTQVFLDILKISPSDTAALRALSVEQLLAAQAELAVRIGQGLAPAIPVVEGESLPEMPLDAFETGRAARVPLLAGSNLDEQRIFSLMDPGFLNMNEQALLDFAVRTVGSENAPVLIDTFKKARISRGEPVTPAYVFSDINTGLMFRMTALRMVEAQARYGQPAYNYLFAWNSPAMGGLLGACHGLEVGFVFGNREPILCGSGPEADKLSAQVQDAWLAFARTGSPACPALGEWPRYSDQRQTMVFSRNSRIEKAPFEQVRRIWETFTNITLANMP
ncbi:MAG: carboxylesterase/lipase family protein [Dehalococcoidales bacterium]|nr:carboxylesterase/lipase family protein [Dehalococcoidales bacterium]